MDIQLFPDIDSAALAEGYTVVIDILRAATVESYALAHGVKEVIPVAKIETAFTIKKEHPEYLLMGEEGGYKVEGFDFGNSPLEIKQMNLTDKTIIHRTSAGTQGLHRATKATRLIFGSFVTCSAIIKDVMCIQPKVVSIVATASEDMLFARFLRDKLLGGNPDMEETIAEVKKDPGVSRFLDATKPEFPLEDFDMALMLDTFDFCCLVTKKNGHLLTQKHFPK